MKIRIPLLSVFSLLVILCITSNSCTIQKRVHRKGWHVSWNKKYKSSNETKATKIASGSNKNQESEHASKSTEIIVEELHTTEQESVNAERNESIPLNTIEETPDDSPLAERTPENSSAETQKRKKVHSHSKNTPEYVPLGAPFVFLGLFTGITIVALAFSAFEVAIAALLVVLAASIIIIHVTRVNANTNSKSHLRPSAFYSSILFLVLCAATAGLIIYFGGLGTLFGILILVVLLLLMSLLAYLIYIQKDMTNSRKTRKEKELQEKKEKEKPTAAEKKKQRTASLIIAGIVIALFLAIGLATN